MYNYASLMGSVYDFSIKQCRQTPPISESASNIKTLHIVNKAGLCLEWLNFNFHQCYGFKLKVLKNLVVTVQAQPVYLKLALKSFGQKSVAILKKVNSETEEILGSQGIVHDHSKTFFNISNFLIFF